MRLVIHDYAGHPFQFDLSMELAKRGFDVTHIYTSASGGPKTDFNRRIRNLRVIDLDYNQIQKSSFSRRFFQEAGYGRKLSGLLDKIKPELVISANTPLPAQFRVYHWCKQNTVPFVFWLQDIISEAIRTILSKKYSLAGSLFSRLFAFIEKKILAGSDHVISICDGFSQFLGNSGVDKDAITIIPNWSPVDQIPVREQNNKWSAKYHLAGKFCLVYSGTLGMKHNPEIIWHAAEETMNDRDIRFIVISEGKGMDYLRQKKEEKDLPNLLLLPFQPYHDLPDVLGSASLILTILDDSAGKYSVPSKVWTGYCARRASLLRVPADNLAAVITKKIEAGVVQPNGADLTKTIMKLKKDPLLLEKMGKNARIYAEKYFDIQTIASKFEKIILNLNSGVNK